MERTAGQTNFSSTSTGPSYSISTPSMQLLLTLILAGLPLALGSVPVFMCSWKISDGSPELVGFEWWCNAEKKITSNATADYACHYVDRVADFGAPGFDRQLRFRAACPHERSDGWGYTSWHGCGNPWAVCVGANGPNDKPIQCFVRSAAPRGNHHTALTRRRPSSTSTLSGSTRMMTVSVDHSETLSSTPREILNEKP